MKYKAIRIADKPVYFNADLWGGNRDHMEE